jgi:tripartite-type tricarboxylate transporter receptor subunit TctC
MRRASPPRWFRASAVAILAGVAALAWVQGTAAQPDPSGSPAWPTRMVRLVCSGAPGSSPDIAARLYAERLSARWGVPVPVDGRPGVDGTLAVQHLLGLRDDHALLFTFIAAVTVAPLVHARLSFDPVADLAPISAAIDDFAAIVAPPGLPVSGLADLVELARRQPGVLNWAAGAGDIYLTFLGFVRRRGLDMPFVAYRAPQPALQDLADGRIHALMLPLVAALPQAQAGRLRMLAVANPVRSPAAPGVPTAAEAGFDELTFEPTLGFFAPRSMPEPLRERIADAVREVAAEPAFRERLIGLGMMARTSTPGEFAGQLRAHRARWAEVARTQGLRPP